MKKPFAVFLLWFLLFFSVKGSSGYMPMGIDAGVLEPSVKHSKNIFVAKVVRKFQRDEKFHQVTFGILYATNGLELKVEKTLLGAIPAGSPVTIAYIRRFESGPGFVPGGDYLFILSQDKPDFLRVADWGTWDAAFGIKGGYSAGAEELDLMSAFGNRLGVDSPNDPEYTSKFLERRLSRKELDGLVRARADRIFGEAESLKILSEEERTEGSFRPEDVLCYAASPEEYANGRWRRTAATQDLPNYGHLLGKAFYAHGLLRKFEVRTKDPKGRWAETIGYYFYENGQTACAQSYVKNIYYLESGKWEKANNGSFDIRTRYFYSADGKPLLRIKEGLFQIDGKPGWSEDPGLEPGYRSPDGVTWEWPGPQTRFEPSKMLPIANSKDLRFQE